MLEDIQNVTGRLVLETRNYYINFKNWYYFCKIAKSMNSSYS